MRAICIFLMVIFILISISNLNADAVLFPPEIKSAVGYVYVLNQDNKKVPYGTGFFVGVRNSEKTRHAIYFVTAKHVLKTPDGKNWLSNVYLRLNKKDGMVEYINIPIIAEGLLRTVSTHDDSDVDLAIIHFHPNLNIIDLKLISEGMITTEEDFKNMEIHEGSDVFFTGLFTPYPGAEKNYPIVRFGRVALITEEKIEWQDKKRDLYLIEAGSYGGNSGSPVFFYFGSDNKIVTVNAVYLKYKLAGVLIGHFGEDKEIENIETKKNPTYSSNLGIAAVVPAYKLHELLYSDELKKNRGF